eukprot:9495064-Pyramimonas_sp.AAC.3
MAEAVLDYSYEYQGNASKLVYTPLTDKCYLTLMQGMQLGYGGNPYGPAGTGKTESVKALGQCLARQEQYLYADQTPSCAVTLHMAFLYLGSGTLEFRTRPRCITRCTETR